MGRRHAVGSGFISSPGCWRGYAFEGRDGRPSAAPMTVVPSGIRRASGIARRASGDVKLDTEAGVVSRSVNRQKNDQYGLGPLPHQLEVRPWGDSCPVRLLSDGRWRRARIRTHRGHLRRMSGDRMPRGSSAPNALLAGLDRTKFGPDGAPVGVADAWERSLEGWRAPPPAKAELVLAP